jgi:hypothetical protein
VVDCVELLVNAVDAPTAVVAWKEHGKLVTQANLAVGEPVAVWDVHPPEYLREGCDDDEFSEGTDYLAYGSV